MQHAHRKTLQAIFADPVPASMQWRRIEALFIAIGCQRMEGPGSAVHFVHGRRVETFHRPHPRKETLRYQVRKARRFLADIGVTP